MNVQNVQTKAKQTVNKGEQKRLRLLALFILGFAVWAGFQLWDQETDLREKAVQLEGLSEQLNEVKKINEQYKREIHRLNDPEYIEQMIRKEYQMMKDGETLFIPTH